MSMQEKCREKIGCVGKKVEKKDRTRAKLHGRFKIGSVI